MTDSTRKELGSYSLQGSRLRPTLHRLAAFPVGFVTYVEMEVRAKGARNQQLSLKQLSFRSSLKD